MKSPIPLLLYLTSAGLFGLAGWTVYEMLPMWKESVRSAATLKGQEDGTGMLTKGRGQSSVSVEWKYGDPPSQHAVRDWWETFKGANLIGKLPPPPPEAKPDVPPPVVEKPVKPLEDIFELVAIVHDTEAGKGGSSHVILRYKPEANVQPPEWWVRENLTASTTSAPVNMPRDVTPRPTNPRNAPAASPAAAKPGPVRPNAPTSAMPTSAVGREMLQKAWVDDGGDQRKTGRLWEPYSDIRLVKVAADAQSAFFVRTPPPPKAGEVAKEPKEEEMLKTSLGLNQEILKVLARLQGRNGEVRSAPAAAVAAPNKWVDVEETKLVGKTVNIGRKDEKRFRENSDEFLTQLNLDTYVSKESKLRGLQVRSVDPQLASRFGVQEGEVLVELNGRPVQTKAQALQLGKADYERGVRTFSTKWWSNGVLIERVYQAPDR